MSGVAGADRRRGRRLTFAILAAALVVAGLIGAWAWLGSDPPPGRDYAAEYRRLTLSGEGEGQNGWEVVEELARVYQEAEAAAREGIGGETRLSFSALREEESDWPGEVELARRAMEELERRGAWALVRRLDEHERLNPPDEFFEQWPEVDRPSWAILGLMSALHTKAHGAVERENAGLVVEAVELMRGLSRVAGVEPLLPWYMTDMVARHVSLSTVQEGLGRRIFDDAAVRRLLAVFEHWEAADLPRALEGERLHSLHVVAQDLDSPLTMFIGGRRGTMAKLDEFYDIATAYARGEAHEALRPGESPDAWAQRELTRHPVAAMSVPAVGPPVRLQAEYAVRLAGVKVLLALEMFWAEHGRYPGSLDDLVPGFLAGLPRSPYDPDGLVYRLPTPEDDLGGRAFLLYSVGADGVDNGGVEHPEGAHRAFHAELGVGYDYVFGGPVLDGGGRER